MGGFWQALVRIGSQTLQGASSGVRFYEQIPICQPPCPSEPGFSQRSGLFFTVAPVSGAGLKLGAGACVRGSGLVSYACLHRTDYTPAGSTLSARDFVRDFQ